MTEILKGKPVADAIDQRSIKTIQNDHLSPVLALFRVGEKEDDLSYERGIKKKADKLGIRIIKHVLSEDVSEDEICEKLKLADQDKEVDGIMIFRPLAKRFNDERIRNCISPEKDIDGCSDLFAETVKHVQPWLCEYHGTALGQYADDVQIIFALERLNL